MQSCQSLNIWAIRCWWQRWQCSSHQNDQDVEISVLCGAGPGWALELGNSELSKDPEPNHLHLQRSARAEGAQTFPGKTWKNKATCHWAVSENGVYCQIAHFNKEHDDESMVFEVFSSCFHRFPSDFSQISRALWVPGPKPGFPLLWPEVFQTLEERGGPEMCGDRQAVPMGPMASEIAGKMDGTWDNMDN